MRSWKQPVALLAGLILLGSGVLPSCSSGGGGSDTFCGEQSPSAMTKVQEAASGLFDPDAEPTPDALSQLSTASAIMNKMARNAPSAIKNETQVLATSLADAKARKSQSIESTQVLTARSKVQTFITANCH